MKGTRKKYDAKFKAKVALEAIKERETLNELAVKYEVSPVMISCWKKEFIENSAAAFEAPMAHLRLSTQTRVVSSLARHGLMPVLSTLR